MIKRSLILFFSILFLTGCSSKTTEKEIAFWTLQMGDFAPYINKVISEYEAKNTNTKIKWVDVPFSEGEKRTLAAVMTDCPPDLINLNPDFSALLAQKGTLYEIDVNKLSDFNPQIVEALKYNDKIYSIPWYATSAITIYNKDLFQKSGLVRLPKTYNELASISEKIKKNTDAYSYLPTITENDTMVKILNKYGISEKEDFNSKQAIKVFEMFKNLYQKDLIPPETITMTHREALEQYMAGKIVFYQGGANFLNMIKENAPKVYAQTDVTEQMKGSLGQNDFSLMNFVIPLRAKNKKEALDFCLYLTNEENQLNLAKAQSPDVICVFMHWGVEYRTTPTEEQERLADLLFQNGADIILGSHPHVLEKMEKRVITLEDGTTKDGFVIYSLGNFMSGQVKENTKNSIILNLKITKHGEDGKITIDSANYIPIYMYKSASGSKRYKILDIAKTISDYESGQYVVTQSEYEILKKEYNKIVSTVGEGF